jgi:lysophospholipase L1-like esterase
MQMPFDPRRSRAMGRAMRWGMVALAGLVAGALAARPADHRPKQVWQGSWASAQQIPEPANALDPADLTDATLRQIVHLSAGGSAVRVRFSNAFGTAPLTIDRAHLARALSPSSSAIDPHSDHALTFDGKASVTIPAGAEYLSDPLDWPLAPFTDLAVSFHLPAAPAQQTGHPGAHATAWLVHGDHGAQAEWAAPRAFEHWLGLSGVEVAGAARHGVVVALGDSITDGHGVKTDSNGRWTDWLARRGQGRHLSVLNLGIGGNRLLLDGLGPNALARFNRDVAGQSGACALILLEGINDIGTFARDPAVRATLTAQDHANLVARIIGAYRQIIERAHGHGLRVMGGTILPFMQSDYYHPDAATEGDRLAVNAWIRAPGHFDALVDFDAALRDPQHPDSLLARYDSGDHLHPSPEGYRVMAQSVPLSFVTGCSS